MAKFITLILAVLNFWPTKKYMVLRRILNSTYFRTRSSLASYLFNTVVRLGH
jgi:hypothetical protein